MNNKQSCYYAYLKAMVGKDRRATEQAKELIRRSYHTEDDKIFYFWLLLFVDDTYNNDQTALYREVKTCMSRDTTARLCTWSFVKS